MVNNSNTTFTLYIISGNLIFRQVRNPPRLDNAISQRIEEDDLPSKKIRVNAQVTFVISI